MSSWKRNAVRMILALLLVGGSVASWAADAPAEAKPETTVDASKGLTFKSGDNSVTFGAYIQPRLIVDDRDNFDADKASVPPTPNPSGYGQADGIVTSFEVARARLSMKGTMWKSWVKYNVSYELSRSGGSRNGGLKDGYIEFAKAPLASVRFGQFKVPFSLQELTADTGQMFVDRAITNVFAPARDAGLMLLGITESKLFGYSVGFFNGAGENNPQNNEAVMYAARVWFDPMGEYKLNEGTSDAPAKNLFHVGLGYRGGKYQKGLNLPTTFENPDNEDAANLELAWKFKRFFATGEYFAQTRNFDNPTAAPDVKSDGWHAEFGVGLPKNLEIGLRYAEVTIDKDTPDTSVTEARAVLNWYLKGHNLKLQLDAGQLTYGANVPATASDALNSIKNLVRGARLTPGDWSDMQYRLQAQINF